MIGPYTEIEVEIEAREPFRIGTGLTEPIDRGEGETSELALILRGASGACAPGSAVKGALRSLAQSVDAANACADLFGPAEIINPKDARMARLTCWSALPVDQGADIETEARTAIEPATGVAQEHRLFHHEVAAAGARLNLRLGLSALATTNERDLLIKLLAIIEGAEGLSLGGGAGASNGRFHADLSTLKVIAKSIGPYGGDVEADETADWRAAIGAVDVKRQVTLHRKIGLTCPDAFICLDSLRKDPKDGNLLLATRVPGRPNSARLSGATIRGGLRAKAVWLARLQNPDHRDNRDLVLDRKADRSADDLAQSGAVCAHVGELTSTELLFGVNGWRGLLSIREVTNEKEADDFEKIPSVKLDRFSGAPIAGGLFAIEAAIGAAFSFNLEVDWRRISDHSDEQKGAEELIGGLIKSIDQSGLMLGHGVNRGYGWFNVSLG